MKLTNAEVFNSRESLQKLITEKLPLQTSYKLAQMAAKLHDQISVIDKVRQKLLQTYGTPNPQNMMQLTIPPVIQEKDGEGNARKDSDGNPIMILNPHYPKCNQEMGELMSIEVELDIEQVTLPEKVSIACEKCGHIMDRPLQIEPATLMMLEKFVKVE